MTDIRFKAEDWIFSYRVAGICVRDGKVLLQKPTNETGFAFPGGHVAFGETNAQTLAREFQEEIGERVTVGELKWVAENFFPWGDRTCHQICLYYAVTLEEPKIPMEGSFIAQEHMDGRNWELEYFWIPLEQVGELEIYPTDTAELLRKPDGNVRHFVYREE